MSKKSTQFRILVIPIATLNKLTPEFNSEFLTTLVKDAPDFGNEYKKYWLINLGLTLQGGTNSLLIKIFTTFTSLAQQKNYNLIQITK